MSVFADLHVHTTNSDGSMELSEVPSVARSADVSVVAITDHDRLHPDLPTPVTNVEGVTIVHGIELRVEAPDGQHVDLLGYGVYPTPELIAELERLQEDRVERGQAIIDCVEDHLDIDLDLESREGLGRPHIARAIDANPDTEHDFNSAFAEVIGTDEPCYVARDIPSFEDAVSLLSESSGLVGLAHPFRYSDPTSALALTSELDAVERYYPYGREVDARPIERAIADNNLVPTGGSDAHEDALGEAGLSKEEYRHFRSAVTL